MNLYYKAQFGTSVSVLNTGPNRGILIFSVIVIYYTDLGGNNNSNSISNILIFKVIVIEIIILH